MKNTGFTKKQHPVDPLLHADSIPSSWCSGCGIGIVVNTFVQAVNKMDIDAKKIHIVSSGIGCTGKVDQHLSFKSDKIIDSDIISYATELAAKKPDTKVVLFLNDTDFISSNIDDLIKAGKKGARILVIYINNYIYRVFMEHKALPNTPFLKDISKNKNISPFNIPHLAKSCGAEYVARWTQLHARRLMFSVKDALSIDGFSVIEVISPCLLYYMNTENAGETIDRMSVYENNSIIKHNEPTENLDIRAQQEIIVGKFIGGDHNE
jgi:2-oxoglutarate ferredoxin oxidoreductase subunit beta